MTSQQISMYCEQLVAEIGQKKALKHALMMASLGRDIGWNPVIRYIAAMGE
jgi:hypothetical protein